ncbi:MAG: UxaA family hydrolase [Thermodesulfobacteriota bacterium]
MGREAIIIQKRDNVATAIKDMAAGREAAVGLGNEILGLTIGQDIPFGHKVAVKFIGQGEEVIKYGAVIGRATRDIQEGEHVHVHNVESLRGRGDRD